MASTEREPAGSLRRLAEPDLPGALELSASANWNQNAADWLAMLALGEGWGIDDVDAAGRERLAASVVVLPYGSGFAWVSMVLVLPAFQRRGHASRLLRHALSWLRARGMTAVLDATPAGHAVYAQEGFVDTWGFARYRREGAAAHIEPPAGPATRAMRDDDWPAIAALDAPAFGADRLPLLRRLAQRWPQAARVAAEAGRLRGFVFGRDGREARQIGPLCADEPATAMRLLGDVLPASGGPLYLDLLDDKDVLLPWLQQQGFALQRPFTRMVHGASSAPGDPRRIVLVAGPELG
jgi:GNAT superfamily N-acetyltransferase